MVTVNNMYINNYSKRAGIGRIKSKGYKEYSKLIQDCYTEAFLNLEQKQREGIKELYNSEISIKLVLMNCRCDIDNAAKPIMDALNSVAFKDDKQIVELCTMHFKSEAYEKQILIKIEYLLDYFVNRIYF